MKHSTRHLRRTQGCRPCVPWPTGIQGHVHSRSNCLHRSLDLSARCCFFLPLLPCAGGGVEHNFFISFPIRKLPFVPRIALVSGIPTSGRSRGCSRVLARKSLLTVRVGSQHFVLVLCVITSETRQTNSLKLAIIPGNRSPLPPLVSLTVGKSWSLHFSCPPREQEKKRQPALGPTDNEVTRAQESFLHCSCQFLHCPELTTPPPSHLLHSSPSLPSHKRQHGNTTFTADLRIRGCPSYHVWP